MTNNEREPLCDNSSARGESSSESRSTLKRPLPILEPAVLLLLFALNLSGTVFQNLVVYQVCTAVYKYNANECSLLGTEKATNESRKIEAEIQPYASKIFMVQGMLESVVPALGSLLIGPWSDKYGRKPVIAAAFIGFSTKYVFFALIAFLSMKTLVNPWFYIIAVIPEIILGGNSSFSIGCISYIRDITNASQRPFRMIIYENSIYAGLLAGSLSSSYIYRATNSLVVLTITAAVTIFLTIYIFLFLEESLETCIEPGQPQFRAVFQFSSVKDVLKTCFKKRPAYNRPIILLTLLTLGLYNFVLRGKATVFYLFVRHQFDWTVKDYTFFESTGIVLQIAGNLLGMVLLRKFLGFSSISLALLAYSSATLSAVVKAVSSNSWHLYVSLGFGILRGVGAPMCFTILTSAIPANETGKMFSLINTIQSILPLASSPLYTMVYNKTIPTFPGAFNFISCALFFLCFIHMSIVNSLKSSLLSSNTYEEL